MLLLHQLPDQGWPNPAQRAIGEIAHDIDRKDAGIAREENGGIDHLVSGLCLTSKDDAQKARVLGPRLSSPIAHRFRLSEV